MGFRFLCKSNLISALSSHCYKTLPPTLLLHSLNPHLLDPSSNFHEIPNYNIPKRWHFGHSHGHSDHCHHQAAGEEGEEIFRLGLATDISLAAWKTFTGYVSGSTAIIADAAHSVSDVVLRGVALWSFKAGNSPRHKEHPYDHFKSMVLQGFFLFS